MLPNFIVIGAAKAGTTALYWYLEEHPDVFMSPVKETNYFAYGVDERGSLLYGDPDVHRFPVKTLEEYERLFDGCRNSAGGRGSVAHLSGVSSGRGSDPQPAAWCSAHLQHSPSGGPGVLRLSDVSAQAGADVRSRSPADRDG